VADGVADDGIAVGHGCSESVAGLDAPILIIKIASTDYVITSVSYVKRKILAAIAQREDPA
jgi:hypothetical protein